MSKLPSLRSLLIVDAVTCAVMGVALATAALPLAALTGLPAVLLGGAGLALLPIAAFMAATAWRPHPAALRLVVLGNAGWVAASLLLLAAGPLAGWATPNALGVAFVLVQALAVAGLALLERAAARTALPLTA